MIDVKVRDVVKNEIGDWKIIHTVLEPLPEWKFTSVGFDPGTAKMGISLIHPTEIDVFDIIVKRSDNPVTRVYKVWEIFDVFMDDFITPARFVIEGAAFAQGFRQVELAEVRASAMLWANTRFFDIEVVNPGTVRKSVFNNGRCKASEFWKQDGLPPNGADALACALYGLL